MSGALSLVRTPDQITAEALSLLPSGWAWSTMSRPDSKFSGLWAGLSALMADWEGDLVQMLGEIDPRTAVWLLPDFERVLGPDPCGRDQGNRSVAQRQLLAYQRWTAAGGQSIAFFEALASAAGFTITINEPIQSFYGAAVYGDVYAVNPEQFIWVVVLPNHETGLECPIAQYSPADTEVVFQYASAA